MDGETDLAVACSPKSNEKLTVRHRVVTPTCVIMSPNHVLARRHRIGFDELGRFPVARSSDAVIDEMIGMRAAVLGIDLDFSFESNYCDGLFGHCADSDAIMFASPMCAESWIARGELVAIPLVNAELFECSIEVLTLSGRRLPAYVEAWIEFLIQNLPAARAAGSLEAVKVIG